MDIKERALIRRDWIIERRRAVKAQERPIEWNEFIESREEPQAIPISKLRVEDMSEEELNELMKDERVTARKMAEKELAKRL